MVGKVNNPTNNHLLILLHIYQSAGLILAEHLRICVDDYSVRATAFLWMQKRLGIYQFPWFT